MQEEKAQFTSGHENFTVCLLRGFLSISVHLGAAGACLRRAVDSSVPGDNGPACRMSKR